MPLVNFFKYFHHFELLASKTDKNECIHLNSLHPSHKKQKDGLERQVIFVDFFFCELEYLIFGVAIQKIRQNSKKWYLAFVKNLLTGTSAFEAVQKISARALEFYANSLKQLILKLHL